MTTERKLVLQEIASRVQPFDAEFVQQQSELKNLGLSRGTIFSALKLFVEAGILVRVPYEGGKSFFLLTSVAQNYILVVCRVCNKFSLYRKPKLLQTLQTDLTPPRFKQTIPFVQIYGICRECAKNN